MFYNFRAGVQGLLAIDSCNYDNWKLGLDIHVSVINHIIVIYIDVVFCCLINSNLIMPVYILCVVNQQEKYFLKYFLRKQI